MRFKVAAFAFAAILGTSAPVSAQYSDGYTFLKAVRESDADKAIELAQQPGSTIVNTRDPQSGETALHIVTKKRDLAWVGFLLQRGADADARDRAGDTPLLLASGAGFADGVRVLIAAKANVNAQNGAGETPLIRAVRARDEAAAELLLKAGADPNLADHVAGLSARDYAEQDRRAAAILKLMGEATRSRPARKAIGPQLGGG